VCQYYTLLARASPRSSSSAIVSTLDRKNRAAFAGEIALRKPLSKSPTISREDKVGCQVSASGGV
jgi:hypothetical protein